MIKGMLSLEQLKEHVTHGEMIPFLLAKLDMQGRLMGKRFRQTISLKGLAGDP